LIFQVIVLAGGLGTRVRELTKNDMPKVMLPIKGKPFIYYLFKFLKEQGLTNIILCTGFKKEVIKSYFGDGKIFGLNVIYSEETSPLGTAGAIKNAEKYIYSPRTFVFNGDTIFNIDIYKLLEFHIAKEAKISIALKYMSDTARYGKVVFDSEGSVTKFAEKGNRGKGYVNGGIYIIESEVINKIDKIPSSLENDILPLYIKKGLYAKPFPSYFVDIGVPEDYEKAKKEFS